MTNGNWKLSKALLCASALAIGSVGATGVMAATVTFYGINDSEAGGLFDPGSTVPDAGDPNTLIIGLDDFSVDGSGILAADTLSFWVEVDDPAYRIVSLTYVESGNANAGSAGTAIATGSVTANGDTNSLASVIFASGADGGWDLDTDYDFSGQVLQKILVTISNSLVAINDASIAKDAASVSVGLALVPVPPAIWLMGSALLGLVAIGRARRAH